MNFKNNTWQENQLHFLKNYYQKAKYFNEIFPLIENIFFSYSKENLIDFLELTMKLCFTLFDIHVEFVRSSRINGSGSFKGEITVDICRKLSATQYLSGQGAIAYIAGELEKQFSLSGIEVLWHQFNHPIYEQERGKPFISGLSCLDILFFEGITKSRELFWNNVRENPPFSK